MYGYVQEIWIITQIKLLKTHFAMDHRGSGGGGAMASKLDSKFILETLDQVERSLVVSARQATTKDLSVTTEPRKLS